MTEISRKDKNTLKKHYYSLVAHPDLCKKLFEKFKIELKTIFYWTDYHDTDDAYVPGKLQYIVMKMYDGAFTDVFTDGKIMDDDFFKRNGAMLIPAPTAEEMSKLVQDDVISMVARDSSYDFRYIKGFDTTVKKEVHYIDYVSCYDGEDSLISIPIKDSRKYGTTITGASLLTLLELLRGGHVTKVEVLCWNN